MNKLEIKSIGVKSSVKATIYVSTLQLMLFVLVGIIAILIGLASAQNNFVFVGMGYLLMSLLFIPISGGLGALTSVVYNFFAKKFGGLEITVNEIGSNKNVLQEKEEIEIRDDREN